MPNAEKCFQVLGLSAGSSKEQIKQAHLDLVKVWHPDRFAHDPRLQKRAEEKLIAINEAYDFLIGAHPQTYRASARPAQPTHPAARSQEPRPKDKYWMMSFVSFITLLIAVAVVSLMFYVFGRPYEPVHSQKTAHELL